MKEPVRLSRINGKRPNGMSLIPWKVGSCVMWDVTVADITAVLFATSVSVEVAAEGAALRKISKYSMLTCLSSACLYHYLSKL